MVGQGMVGGTLHLLGRGRGGDYECRRSTSSQGQHRLVSVE